MKSKNTTKISNLITKRNEITKEITRYWKIIYTENKVQRGYTRNFDIRKLIENIDNLAAKLLEVKLRIQCANMGITYKHLDPNANIINVYKLSSLTEKGVKLLGVPTISPTLKAKKGARVLNETEILTSSYIKLRMKEVELEKIKLNKAIQTFNDELDIDLDEVPMSVTTNNTQEKEAVMKLQVRKAIVKSRKQLVA